MSETQLATPLSTEAVDELYIDLGKKVYHRNFYKFFKKAWEILEPGTDFEENWHHSYIAEKLQAEGERVIEGRPWEKDIIINVPPSTTKSLMVTVCWPVWLWIRQPSLKIISASYDLSLAINHSLKSRDIIRSDWFQERWGSSPSSLNTSNWKSSSRKVGITSVW